MDVHDEKYLIERVKAGDKEAFTGLVDTYKNMVYTVCLRMLGSEADAEEAAQDVFIKAYRSIGSFQAKAKFSTWLYRIAYNNCISPYCIQQLHLRYQKKSKNDRPGGRCSRRSGG